MRSFINLCGRDFGTLRLTIAVIIIALFALSGCTTSKDLLGNTTASYVNGNFSWDSTKNQENLDATYDKQGEDVKFTIKTTATTPEAAMLAVAQVRLAEMKLIADLIDKLVNQLATGAAAKGAGS